MTPPPPSSMNLPGKDGILAKRRVYILYAILFSVVWVFLFPAINITSGELKPRGFYVDEHAFGISALLESHNNYPHTVHYKEHKIEGKHHLECSFDWMGRNIPPGVHQFHAHTPNLLEVGLWSKVNPMSQETTVMVVPLYEGSSCDVAIDITFNLIRNLRKSKWWSRNFILLYLMNRDNQKDGMPYNSTTSSKLVWHTVLREWVKEYTHERQAKLYEEDLALGKALEKGQCPSTRRLTMINYKGILRDAVVLDLGSQFPQMHRNRLQYENLVVSSTGLNGDQANMDMVSLALMLRPSQSKNADSLYDGRSEDRRYVDTEADVFNKMDLINAHDGIGFGVDSKASDSYWHRLKGLGKYCLRTLYAPMGLHFYFLSANIDAITFSTKAMPDIHLDVDNKGKSKRHGLKPAQIYEMMMIYLHSLSNLHEELHHSIQSYLFLGGSKHFVGFTEFATVGVLLVVIFIITMLSYLDTAECKSAKLYYTTKWQLGLFAWWYDFILFFIYFIIYANFQSQPNMMDGEINEQTVPFLSRFLSIKYPFFDAIAVASVFHRIFTFRCLKIKDISGENLYNWKTICVPYMIVNSCAMMTLCSILMAINFPLGFPVTIGTLIALCMIFEIKIAEMSQIHPSFTYFYFGLNQLTAPSNVLLMWNIFHHESYKSAAKTTLHGNHNFLWIFLLMQSYHTMCSRCGLATGSGTWSGFFHGNWDEDANEDGNNNQNADTNSNNNSNTSTISRTNINVRNENTNITMNLTTNADASAGTNPSMNARLNALSERLVSANNAREQSVSSGQSKKSSGKSKNRNGRKKKK
jgi:hypothetical protein